MPKEVFFFWKSCTDEVTISFHHHLLKASLEIEFIKRNKEEIFYRRYKSADIYKFKTELHSNIDKK